MYIHLVTSQNTKEITLEEAYEAGQSCACFHLRRAARAVTQRYDEALRPVGLRATQFSMLTMIRGRGPLSLQDLARRLVMDRTTLSRNLRPLQDADYVLVEPGKDRRVREISITQKGHGVLARAYPLWRQVQEGFADQLGDQRFGSMLSDLSASVEVSLTD